MENLKCILVLRIMSKIRELPEENLEEKSLGPHAWQSFLQRTQETQIIKN